MKNIHGGGQQTNINGLRFERKTDIKEAVIDNDELELLNDNEVYKDELLLGYVFKGHEFYRFFDKKYEVDLRNVLSKKLLPDNCFYNVLQSRLYIVENKYQESAGSVDEKIQTFNFKRRQYIKMMLAVEEVSDTKIDVDYIYVLNNWFKKSEYNDILREIRESGCNYYFEELPLNKIGIY